MSEKPVAVVTGGAGFIGSHAVDLLLAEGFSVRVIDNLVGGRLENLSQHKSNPDLTVETRDIRSLSEADKLFANAKYVLHFAGIGDIVPSIDRPVDYLDTNVMGTVKVLEAARHAAVTKLVYAASSSCYGAQPELPTSESAAIDPCYPYALSKYMGEEAVFHWHRVYGLPVNSIRIFNAYGTRSKTSGAYGAVFGVFLAQKLAGKPFTVVGDGTQTRDFVFVTDVARAFYFAAKSESSGEVFNLGAGNPQSVNRLIELLEAPGIEYLPKRPGEPECTWAKIDKINSLLNWQAEISFEQGVGEMLDQIDYWREAPVWDKLSIEKATSGWFEALGGSSE